MDSRDICPVCVTKVIIDDKSKFIQCGHKCQRFFHSDCTKLSNTEFSKLVNPRTNENRKWVCGREDCVSVENQPHNVLLNQLKLLNLSIASLTTKVDTLTTLPSKVDNLITQVESLSGNLKSLESRVAVNEAKMVDLEAQLSNVKDAPLASSSLPVNPEQIVAELNDRSRRSKNVMLFNLPESSDKNVDIRKQHDLNLLLKLFNVFLPTFDVKNLKAVRAGKKSPSKMRPLKAILDCESNVVSFLSSFSSEAAGGIDPSFSTVRASRDRTPREMDYYKSLKSELDSRISKGEDVVIKYKNNIPCIVKNQKN